MLSEVFLLLSIFRAQKLLFESWMLETPLLFCYFVVCSGFFPQAISELLKYSFRNFPFRDFC